MTVESPLTSLSFMQDGATLAAGSTRGKIYVFDLRMGSAPLKTLNAHKSSVQAIRFQYANGAPKVGAFIQMCIMHIWLSLSGYWRFTSQSKLNTQFLQ